MVVLWLYIWTHTTRYCMRSYEASVLYPDFMEDYIFFQ